MTHKTWRIHLEGGDHTIELQHGTFSGKRSIHVDGEEQVLPKAEQAKFWDTGSTHTFRVSGHPCMIAIRSSGLSFDYELFVDGVSIDSGLPVGEKDPSKPSPEAIRARRTGVIAVCSIAGVFCLWFNWRSVTMEGFYSRELAMLGPAALVIAAYYAIYNDDPWELPKPLPIRLIVMLVIAIALGIANWYATENGLY